jgi:hypothetical protein
MRIVKCGLMILLALPGELVLAQQPTPQKTQTDSLAAAARRARAQQKEKPKAVVVWNDDNIASAESATISVVGPAAASGQESNQPANGKQTAVKPVVAAAHNPSLESDLNAAKEELKNLQTDLDLLQRKNQLDAAMYYGKPDYTSDTDGASQIKDEQDQIAAKQQAVDDQQKKVDDLQAQLDAQNRSTGDTEKSTDTGETSNSNSASSSTGNTSDTANTPDNTNSSDTGNVTK